MSCVFTALVINCPCMITAVVIKCLVCPLYWSLIVKVWPLQWSSNVLCAIALVINCPCSHSDGHMCHCTDHLLSLWIHCSSEFTLWAEHTVHISGLLGRSAGVHISRSCFCISWSRLRISGLCLRISWWMQWTCAWRPSSGRVAWIGSTGRRRGVLVLTGIPKFTPYNLKKNTTWTEGIDFSSAGYHCHDS